MSAAGAAGWKETIDQNSKRPYFYQQGTQQTSWVKPDELLTPAQLATGWAETSDATGRRYWYNKQDKSKTAWQPPPGWSDALLARPEEPSGFVSSSLNYVAQRDQAPRDSRPRDDYRPSYERRDDGGYRGPTASTPGGIEYSSPAEAEAAFTKLLTKAGVQTNWTWEQAMRATIQDPAFRAIKEPTARKEAFEDFQIRIKEQDKEREKERAAKLRTDFRAMLGRHSEIRHYTRWKSALSMIEGEQVYRASDNVDEKKRLFQEYVMELRHQYEEKRYEDHEGAMREIAGLLREVNLSPETRWEDAQKRLQSFPAFADDERFKTLTKSEILDTFTAQVRGLWEDVNTIKQREKQLEGRRARKAREGFIDLLRDLQDDDKFRLDSRWKDILPLVEDDSRYQAAVETARPGEPRSDASTPQDLFFDLMERLQDEVDDIRRRAESVMKDLHFRISNKTSSDEFCQIMGKDKRLARATKSQLEVAFKRLQQQALGREEDVAREKTRDRKKNVDALRSRIKRLDPFVELDDTWDEVRPRLEKFEEYTILNDEDRRAAFDKHKSRLQDDYDRERSRKHDRDPRRDDRRDDRRRGDRRRSRSPPNPELDPYEADRRRAQEQRERNYHRSSNGGLSPPPRERDRRSGGGGPREERFERDMDRASISRYERERRERDAERERAYVTRADPYAKAADLDYGDSSDGPGSVSRPASSHGGKRAGSESVRGGERASKRPRTEGRLRSATPVVAKTKNEAEKVEEKEEIALQSGSEEGEIEEV